MPTATEPPADGPAEDLDSAWSDIEPGFAGNGEAQFASHDGSACSAPIRSTVSIRSLVRLASRAEDLLWMSVSTPKKGADHARWGGLCDEFLGCGYGLQRP